MTTIHSEHFKAKPEGDRQWSINRGANTWYHYDERLDLLFSVDGNGVNGDQLLELHHLTEAIKEFERHE